MRVLCLLALSALAVHAEVTYKIRLTTDEGNRVVELSAEKYVTAVLAGESSVFRSDEALKAMAVTARTYAARLHERHAAEGFDFCSTTHCQRVDLRGITPQFIRAAEATAGELLWFEGKPAYSVYARDCGGETEASEAVWPDLRADYLTAHADPYCTRHGATSWSWTVRPEQAADALRQSQLASPAMLRRIAIRDRTQSGRAKTLELEGGGQTVLISAGSFRFAVGRKLGWNTLRSDRYEVEVRGDQIYFHGAGEGHGIGLCQHGADEMGLEGYTYRDILAFYYPGTSVARTGTGLKWSPLSGEGVVIFTTHADRDSGLLKLAEQVRGGVVERLHLAPPGEIEIRVYPDIETFRDATGEPGWIAAHATGSRIDLQPVEALRSRGILEKTVRHEMFHVFIESQAAPGLPLWFREGLVECVEYPTTIRPVRAARMDDDGVRQRQNRGRAEQAYQAARNRVALLVNRYGEEAVLGWLTRGLPAEVRNSNPSSAPTNSK